MAEYGYHPTIYGGFSDEALFSLYRGEEWSRMNEFARRELLQETVNRAALANGEKGACQVVFSDLGPGTAGVQSGNVIQLDRSRFVNDEVRIDYGGRTISMPLEDSNMKALETVLHEDIHAWQNQCIDGTISNADGQLLAEYRANNFDVRMVETADGNTAMGQQYLRGQSENGGYYLYYFQSTERDAHKFAELKTQQIMTYLEQNYGSEPSFEAYKENIAANGYEATLQAAQNYFGTETVEQDINQTLMNQYYMTNEPVNSQVVEEAVKQEMVGSLQNNLHSAQTQSQTQDQSQQQAPSLSEALSGSDVGAQTENLDDGLDV